MPQESISLTFWSAIIAALFGLVGAIVGGLIAGVYTTRATKSANESNAKLAELERVKRNQDERCAAVSAVLAEIRFNIKLASDPLTTTTNALPLFSMELWQANKGVLLFMEEKMRWDLQAGYIALAVANTQATYTLTRLPYGSGYLNDRYKEYVKRMADDFALAETLLDQWLKSNVD